MPTRTRIVLWLCRILLAAVALGLLLAPLGFGFFTSRLNFTYGARGLDPSFRGPAALRVLLWIAAGVLFEAIVRRGLLERLRVLLGTRAAVLLHLFLLNLLLLPLLIRFGVRTDALSTWQMLLYENLLQILFTLTYLGTGSFFVSGSLQGLFAALRFTLINDVSGPFETLFFYSYSDRGFGWVLTLSPLLGSIWVWLASSTIGMVLGPSFPRGAGRGSGGSRLKPTQER